MNENNHTQEHSAPKARARFRRVRRLLFTASFILLAAVWPCYSWRPDFLAALTFYPPWVWLAGGLALGLPSARSYKYLSAVLIVGWLLFAGVFVEEFTSMLRSPVIWVRSNAHRPDTNMRLRVITLNCAGGNLNAVRDALNCSPDIILLQEAPPEERLLALARDVMGERVSLAWASDTAVLARGDIVLTDLPRDARTIMTQAHIRLMSGYELEAISVHLMPPATALNLLSTQCWREHRDDRRLRREQVARICEQIRLIPETVPLVIGGDFNVTAGDGSLNCLRGHLSDSFKNAGIGWPNTGPSHCPLWRVDQIWLSHNCKTIAVRTRKTSCSDHRMVIGEFQR